MTAMEENKTVLSDKYIQKQWHKSQIAAQNK